MSQKIEKPSITDKNTKKPFASAALPEPHYKEIFLRSPESININRLEDGLYLDVNDEFQVLTGYERFEIIGKTIFETHTWHDENELEYFLHKLKKDGRVKNFEAKFRLKDGLIRTGLISATIIRLKEKPLILSVARDITELKKKQAIQRKEHNLLYRLMSTSPVGIITLNTNYQITFVNIQAENIIGRNRKEIMRLPVDAAEYRFADFQGTPVEKEYSIFSRLLSQRKAIHGDKLTITHPNGEKLFLSVNGSPLFDTNGEVEGAVVTLEDISKQIKIEKALVKSERKYRSVFENSGAPAIILEKDMTISLVNPKFEELTGYDREALEGKMKWTDLIVDVDAEALSACHDKDLVEEEVPRQYECTIADRNGQIKNLYITVGAVPGTSIQITSIVDMTDRKLAEEMLKSREKDLMNENFRLKSSLRERYRFGKLIGKSKIMQSLYQEILKTGATNANVIIYGESGTGKELTAKAIHDVSERHMQGFVPVNCGAIPEQLLESEFFGYKKGAFSGADTDKKGFLDAADGGTLFLDEVGEIGLQMQVKLLRAIEGGGYTPVGGNEIKYSDFRIIAATHRDLNALVNQGVMREDFYYRIHIIPIKLPSLRERKEDLPLLIYHFMEQFEREQDLPPIAGKTMQAMLDYDWPGNVRELQNVLNRYATMGKIDFANMPSPKSPPEVEVDIETDQNQTLRNAMEQFEEKYIRRMLEKNNWNRTKTAEELGIGRRTLFRKMKLLNME